MTKELDEKLVKKYPKIFADRYADKKNTCMCFGFNCGDGWYWVIDNLCHMMQWCVDNKKENNERNKKYNEMLKLAKEGDFSKFDEYYKEFAQKFIDEQRSKIDQLDFHEIKEMYQPVAAQVKEKFGSLRFYIDGGDETIYNYISFAEYLSNSICEQCGTTENVGHTQWPSWIFTLCEDCAIKSKKIDIWKKNE